MAEQKYIGIETMSEIIRRHYVGYGINNMIAELKDNAVNARPVVIGRWIDRGEHEYIDQETPVHLWQCSICGKHETKKSSFCPNCNADMREATMADKHCNSDAPLESVTWSNPMHDKDEVPFLIPVSRINENMATLVADVRKMTGTADNG